MHVNSWVLRLLFMDIMKRVQNTSPPTTGYANPSKTTFSSAQMFSCEAL